MEILYGQVVLIQHLVWTKMEEEKNRQTELYKYCTAGQLKQKGDQDSWTFYGCFTISRQPNKQQTRLFSQPNLRTLDRPSRTR